MSAKECSFHKISITKKALLDMSTLTFATAKRDLSLFKKGQTENRTFEAARLMFMSISHSFPLCLRKPGGIDLYVCVFVLKKLL